MDGVLVVDKPPHWTSHDVVAKIRNLTKIKKVGHTGTLDPFATGVLPLTLGRATRLSNYFLASDKSYHGVIRFGFATTTFDLDGEPTSKDARPVLDAARLEEIFSRFVGRVSQTLPPFSAKKVRGRPMYAYARKGIELEPSTKDVTIQSLELIRVSGCEAEFVLVCSAGTYARSLAHDLGTHYGCGAHLVRLGRTRSGEFTMEAAVSLYEGSDLHSREYFLDHIVPMRDLLTEIPAVVVSGAEKEKILHGMDLNTLTGSWESDQYRILDESGNLIALARRLQTFASPLAQPAHWVRIHPHITLG